MEFHCYIHCYNFAPLPGRSCNTSWSKLCFRIVHLCWRLSCSGIWGPSRHPVTSMFPMCLRPRSPSLQHPLWFQSQPPGASAAEFPHPRHRPSSLKLWIQSQNQIESLINVSQASLRSLNFQLESGHVSRVPHRWCWYSGHNWHFRTNNTNVSIQVHFICPS